MTPLEITAGTISVANGTFTLATNFWKLRSVDHDLKVCLQLLGIITQDIYEARQLRNRKRDLMSATLLARVERAIEDLDIAARGIGKTLETSRVQKGGEKLDIFREKICLGLRWEGKFYNAAMGCECCP